MNNKIILIIRLMSAIFINMFLLNIFINIPNTKTKIVLLPFLICGLTVLGQAIFMLLNKPKYVHLLKKVYVASFLLYCVGFLIFWCYLNIIDKNYILLLFSIPFWLIVIYIAKRYLFGIKDHKPSRKSSSKSIEKTNKKLSPNFKVIISISLIGFCIICGLIMLFSGIKGVYESNIKTKNYKEVEGNFAYYDIYSKDEDGTTYKLTYTYVVDEQEYTVSTNYGTGLIPEENSTKTIKYNPDNPKEAVIVGSSNSLFLLFMGFMFIMVPTIILLGALSTFGIFRKIKIDFIGIIIGMTFIVIGSGAFYMITGSFSIVEFFKSYSLSYLIPFLIMSLFVVVGIYLIIKSLFLNKKSK